MDTEARIQADCFTWFWNQYPHLRRLMFHIPNGGKRTKYEAARFKAMGVVPGIPDLFLAIPKGGYHGMFIEMKRPGDIPDESGRLSKHDVEQMDTMNKFDQQGYFCVYCDSVERFKIMILGYLTNGQR